MVRCLVLAAVFLVPVADAYAVARPTVKEAKHASRSVFSDLADVTDSRLSVSKSCPAKGRLTRVCHVRVSGAENRRYRVTVTGDLDNFVIRARPVG